MLSWGCPTGNPASLHGGAWGAEKGDAAGVRYWRAHCFLPSSNWSWLVGHLSWRVEALAAIRSSWCFQLQLVCKFIWRGVMARVTELESQRRIRPACSGAAVGMQWRPVHPQAEVCSLLETPLPG